MKKGRPNRRRNVHAKNRKKRNWFAPFGILLVLSLMVYIPKFIKKVGALDFSKVKNLQVLGANALSSVDIVKLSGLTQGMDLSGETTKVAAKKIQGNPRLSQVTIMKDMTGEVVIRVRERKPIAMIQVAEQMFYVDGQGRILNEISASEAKAQDTYPILTGDWKRDEVNQKAVEGISFRNALIQNGLDEKKISELHFDSREGWVLYQVDFKVPVIFGSDQYEEKTQRLLQLLEKFRTQEDSISEIDLDFNAQAIVKMKDAA